MDYLINKESAFWSYLSQGQRDLLDQGLYLMDDIIRDHAYQFKDYSFLVFPFAKAYEGFLKQIFRDKKLISRLDYISDHLRLGKLMSPNLIGKLGPDSLYLKIENGYSKELAEKIWHVWKNGRNQIFHYFPHNIKAISFNEARGICMDILRTMEEVFDKLESSSSYKVHKVDQEVT
ncbi:MAG: hypothetical protein AAB441_03940 [Patescibacteria group bacterium]